MINYLLYPDDWQRIASEIKVICAWRCQACGKQCRRPGEMSLGWQYELSVAHLTQDYDAEAVTVAALCKPCHLAHDSHFSGIARQRRQRLRRQIAGQLDMMRSLR
jgi:hypothetical protein